MKITKFKQESNALKILIADSNAQQILVTLFRIVPRAINDTALEKAETWKKEFTFIDNFCDVYVDYSDYDEPIDSEYSLLFIAKGANHEKFSYFEIVRQSEIWLKENFGFCRRGGYCIEGRSSFSSLEKLEIQWQVPLFLFGKGEIINSILERKTDSYEEEAQSTKSYMRYPEIIHAKKILSKLTALPLNTGPVGSSHQQYYKASLDERIEMLINGDYAVQCSGFRDLFVWLYRAQGLPVRVVDANCTLPRFNDLVSYGHSLCEIFIKEINRWVIFDPWFAGAMVVDKDSLVGIEKLNELDCSHSLSLISVVTSYDRHIHNGFNGKNTYKFDVKSLNLHNYSFSLKFGSFQPAYLEYFRFFRVRYVHVAPRFLKGPVNIIMRFMGLIISYYRRFFV